jgi:hypothetical protein
MPERSLQLQQESIRHWVLQSGRDRLSTTLLDHFFQRKS